MTPIDQSTPPAGEDQPRGTAPIQDRRPKPRGVLPRQIQMWLMAGIALIILLIILFTGRSEPGPRAVRAERPADPVLPAAERIRSYRQQLAEEQARQQQILAREKLVGPQAADETARNPPPDSSASDPLVEERRRRDYQSLFADSVALSRRPADQQPYGEHGARTQAASSSTPSAPDLALFQQALRQVGGSNAPVAQLPQTPPQSAPSAPITPDVARGEAGQAARDENPAPGPRLPLLEGTVIEAVLANRLDGALAGPVNGLVTNPVYSQDRQSVLIPAGARVLGAATPVQSWGENRLAVSFHRLVMPDGHTYSLDRFKGLDQIGETGLRDRVNRHYLQVFGASLAIGAISGLAQYNTRGGFDYTFGDAYRQSAGASLANSTARVLDRYLNVLPTITIREGYRLKVYLTNDLELPAYSSTEVRGGVR